MQERLQVLAQPVGLQPISFLGITDRDWKIAARTSGRASAAEPSAREASASANETCRVIASKVKVVK